MADIENLKLNRIEVEYRQPSPAASPGQSLHYVDFIFTRRGRLERPTHRMETQRWRLTVPATIGTPTELQTWLTTGAAAALVQRDDFPQAGHPGSP